MAESGYFIRYQVFNNTHIIYFPTLSQYHTWKAEMEAVQVESFKILEILQ